MLTNLYVHLQSKKNKGCELELFTYNTFFGTTTASPCGNAVTPVSFSRIFKLAVAGGKILHQSIMLM